MNDDFVTYELAVKLKENGFDEPCYGYYHWYGGNDSFELCGNGDRDFLNSKNQYRVAAPTISQILKWLREEKKVHIGFGYSPRKKWRHVVMYLDDRFYNKPTLTVDGFLEIEQAALAGIEYVLDNLI